MKIIDKELWNIANNLRLVAEGLVMPDEDVKKKIEILKSPLQQQVKVEAEVGVPSETLSCELEGRIKEAEYWQDFIFNPKHQPFNATVCLTDFVFRINELKASKP